ncbi:right-handed parallel beta-helix repeat-containing protein [Kribbella shirazensis]|uniref:Parallel beta helix pectate lyase-like protein n=1 Tax=Kribbella shirazensis TaxID=1105143 RepID=A0A7X5VHY5_9ACTN|nr:right-handed parallel beta-helix repeat-containing protein [Kribbella shirazensis]NIK61555.1 hypothetical protein [Kribbella shirazensis]
MNRRRILGLVGLIAAGLIAGPAVAPPALAETTGQDHYVSNRAGCSDDGPGTAPDRPWCGFAPVAAHDFQPGDQLLLERGASFAEGLVFDDSGSAEAPITIGAYGSGPRPKITNSATKIGMVLKDASHVRVRDLDIGSTTNGKATMTYGIQANYASLGHSDVIFEDLFLHDNRWLGLLVASSAVHTTTDTVLEGLVIRRVEGTRNAHTLATTSYTSPTDLPKPVVPGKAGENVFRNVVLDRLYLHDDNNNNPVPTPGMVDSGCPDGLALQKATNVVLMNSIFDNEASCRTTTGTAALYLGSVRQVLIANNLFVNTPNTENPDMVAIDHEARTSEVEIRGNYFGNNYGGGLEYLAIHGANDFHADGVVADNVFTGNGGGALIPYPAGGSVGQLGDDIPIAAAVTGNLHSEPHAFVEAKLGGDTSRFTIKDNVEIGDPGDLYHAGSGFADDQAWGQRRLTAGGWRALPFDEASQSYRAGESSIDRFTLTSGDALAVARTWTAPKAGVLNLRGLGIAVEGAARLAITLNGKPVAEGSVAADRSWTSTVEDLRVAAGDVIGFEARGGTVSWAPGIGYSAAARATDPAGSWTFSVNGDRQGWTSDDPAVVRRGKLEVAGAGATTELRSTSQLGIDVTDRGAVRISALNRTAATDGVIDFVTADGRKGRQEFVLNAAQPKGLTDAYTDYLVPMRDPHWRGKITKLTITLHNAVGPVSIDSIAFDRAPQHAWEFGAADGWTIDPDVSCPSVGTPARTQTPAVDNSEGTFTKHADIAWAKGRLQTFGVPDGNLSRLDLWAYQTGNPTGCLFLQVVRVDERNQIADRLFTGAVPASKISGTGDFVSVFPNLHGLDPNARYGVLITSPYQLPGAAAYGIGYNDQGLFPEGGEFYTVDAAGIMRGPEASGKRSLRFRTFSSTEVVEEPNEFVPVSVTDGTVRARTGYEPVLLSPSGLKIDAAKSRYVRIRMNNPEHRHAAHLLFSTADDPSFDQPKVGTPPGNEEGGRGVAIALLPGPDYVEYVIDMSHVPGWKGEIDQLMIQPLNRWNYRFSALHQNWTGGIDYVRVD